MMMVVVPADRLSQILDAGELAARRGAREVLRKLVELVRRCRITVGLRCLSGALQVRRDLLGHLLVHGRIGLLKLLADRYLAEAPPMTCRLRRSRPCCWSTRSPEERCRESTA